MKYFFSLCVVFLLWVNVSGQESSAGQKDAVIMTAKKLMEYKKADIGGLFSASFVKALPKQKITAILEEFNKEYGAYVKIRQKGGTSLEYFYEKALIPGTLHLDKEGKIDGLWFGAPKIFADTYDSVLVELKKLSGSVAVTIRKNGKENILTYNNTLPLAVGSSFKIAVLRALVEKINKGEAMWATVIPLDKNKMAFPSGSLQTWKPGTPMTLASLANLMISRSDNTAADHLLFYCGRENVEKYVPERDHPYLSTLEMVKMKYGMNAEDAMLRDKYLEANSTDKKRLVLAEVDSVTRNDVDPTSDPKDIGTIEWFYTTDELCDLIDQVHDEPAMQINPGVADTADWKTVAYKGGSEPGVLNMTHVLVSKKTNNFYTISITENDPAKEVDEGAFSFLVERFIGLIHANDK